MTCDIIKDREWNRELKLTFESDYKLCIPVKKTYSVSKPVLYLELVRYGPYIETTTDIKTTT